MIDALNGVLAAKTPTAAVVRVGGFDLRLLISVSCFETLPAVGKEVHLLTYLHVREDAMLLYGFADVVERDLFERLISVSGIGPRLAVGILSGATAGRVREAIDGGDSDFLQSLPGVGKKLAQRLVVELREKATSTAASAPTGAAMPGALNAGIGADAHRRPGRGPGSAAGSRRGRRDRGDHPARAPAESAVRSPDATQAEALRAAPAGSNR